MKYSFSLLAILLCSICFSQNNDDEQEKLEKEFKEILNIHFSKVVTGNSFSNFGNFATINSDDKSLSASINIIEQKGKVINVNVSGGATNGISELFSEGDLNSNISLGASFHLLCNSNNTLVGRDIAIRNKLDLEEKKVNDTFVLDSISALEFKAITFNELKLYYAKEKLKKLKIAKTKIDNENKNELNRLKSDSLSFAIQILSHNNEQLFVQIKKLKDDKTFYLDNVPLKDKNDYLLLDSKLKRDLALEKIKEKRRTSEIEELSISWFSFGYGVRKDAFKFFDGTQVLPKQIKDSSYVSHSIKFAFSRYDWSSANSFNWYVSGGAEFNYSSNLNTLSVVEIKDIRQVSEDPNREVIKSQKVFEGIFEEDIKEISPFIDLYLFYGKEKSLALHINPKVVYQDDKKPTSSFKIGLLVPFKKTKEQTSIINLEVYYKLNNVFNTLESKKSLLGRNSIGIQATFPISFL